MVTHFCDCTKNHGLVHKWVNCMVYDYISVVLLKIVGKKTNKQCSCFLRWLSEVFPVSGLVCCKDGMIQNSQVWRKGPKTDAGLT